MDTIRSKQISEALNYDRNANAMVFNLEKKNVATFPDEQVLPYSQIDAETLTQISEGIKALTVLLDKKYANLSLMIRPGSTTDSQEFAMGASEIGQIELVIQIYNQIVFPYSSPNLTQQTRQQILMRTHDMMKPIARIVTGLKKAINGLVSDLRSGSGSSGSIGPTITFYFVRCVEALGLYVIIYEQLKSGKIQPITDNDLTPRIWDLINKQKSWRSIADGKNVDKLFRDFNIETPGGRGQSGATAPPDKVRAAPFAASEGPGLSICKKKHGEGDRIHCVP